MCLSPVRNCAVILIKKMQMPVQAKHTVHQNRQPYHKRYPHHHRYQSPEQLEPDGESLTASQDQHEIQEASDAVMETESHLSSVYQTTFRPQRFSDYVTNL